jgi:hypothetical protein
MLVLRVIPSIFVLVVICIHPQTGPFLQDEVVGGLAPGFKRGFNADVEGGCARRKVLPNQRVELALRKDEFVRVYQYEKDSPKQYVHSWRLNY